MKKYLLLIIATLSLIGCNSTPGQPQTENVMATIRIRNITTKTVYRYNLVEKDSRRKYSHYELMGPGEEDVCTVPPGTYDYFAINIDNSFDFWQGTVQVGKNETKQVYFR